MKDLDDKEAQKKQCKEQILENQKGKNLKKKKAKTLLVRDMRKESTRTIVHDILKKPDNIMKLEIDEKINALYENDNTTPFFVDVPLMNYFTYRSTGDPSDYGFQIIWDLLFNLSNRIKYDWGRHYYKLDYKVYPMEIDWFPETNNERYNWKMMIMQPSLGMKEWHYLGEIEKFRKSNKLSFIPFVENLIDKNLLYSFTKSKQMTEKLIKNDFSSSTSLYPEFFTHFQDEIAFESIEYGKCIQCLHFGEYVKMDDTLKKITEYGRINGYKTDEVIHTIYLNESGKTKPEKLKTIVRVKIIENPN